MSITYQLRVTCNGKDMLLLFLLAPTMAASRPPLTIVHGKRVAPKFAYPWMIFQASEAEGGPFCGGTMIDRRGWILTAAHCLYATAAAERKVTVGLHRWNYSASAASEGGLLREVVAFHHHPKYNAKCVLFYSTI